MSEEKYKAKRVDNEEWVEGFMIFKNVIAEVTKFYHEDKYSHDVRKVYRVDPKTLVQISGKAVDRLQELELELLKTKPLYSRRKLEAKLKMIENTLVVIQGNTQEQNTSDAIGELIKMLKR